MMSGASGNASFIACIARNMISMAMRIQDGGGSQSVTRE